jgi:hypothetical protein
MVAAVRDFEKSGLSERHKVALRLVDAFIVGLGHVPEDLARAARACFSDAELLDIVAKIAYSTSNKIRVALAIDDPEGIEKVVGIRSLEYPVAPDFVPRGSPPLDAGQ